MENSGAPLGLFPNVIITPTCKVGKFMSVRVTDIYSPIILLVDINTLI